jgi:hypothetical protein
MFLLCSVNLAVLVKKEITSSYIITMLFCLSYVPCVVYFEKSGSPSSFLIQLNVYWFLLITFTNIFPAITLRSDKPTCGVKSSQKIDIKLRIIGDLIVAFLAVYVCIVKYRFNGFYIQLDFETVYDLRIAAAAGNFSGLSNYILSWASLVFTIRGVVAAGRREFLLLFLLIVLQIINFSIAGHKFVLFSLPIALLLSGFYRERLVYYIPALFLLFSLVAKFLWSAFGFIFFIYFIPFRNMFLPALTSGNFLDFFSKHRPDFLAQSVLSRFGVESDYALPLPYLIDDYYSDGTASANTGLVADAVSNFGFFGVIIYPVFFAVILRMLDAASKNLSVKYNAGIIIFFSISFLNTAFFTSLLTGGVLFALFFLNTQSVGRLK